MLFAVSLRIFRPTFMSTPWKIVLTHISHTAPDLHIAKTSTLLEMVTVDDDGVFSF